MNITDKNWFGSLEQMLDDMPQNRVLYRDSGLWRIYAEDFRTILFQQTANEDFDQFIRRAYEAENIYHDMR